MLKHIGEKIFTVYAQKFCLSKPLSIHLIIVLSNLAVRNSKNKSCRFFFNTLKLQNIWRLESAYIKMFENIKI